MRRAPGQRTTARTDDDVLTTTAERRGIGTAVEPPVPAPSAPTAPSALPKTPTPLPDPAAARHAALTLLISSTLFAVMAALTKVATRRLPGPEVALMRFAAGVVLTAAAVAIGSARIRPRRWAWLGARGFFGGVSVVT